VKLEPIDVGSVDWGRLDGFADRVVFQTREWLSFVSRSQDAEPVVATLVDAGQRAGYFTGLVFRRYGVRILGSPFPGWTTAYLGFNLEPGVPRRAAWAALPALTFGPLRCLHLEARDRLTTEQDVAGLGFATRWLTTFEVDLRPSEDELMARMTSACRRCIRKAERESVVIEEASDERFADEYHEQLRDVYAKQSLVPMYGPQRVRELIRNVHPTGRLLLLRARDRHGRCIATGVFPAMNGVMYFWGGASWRRHQIVRPNEAVFWYAMRYWKARGMTTFDMGGGGEYKRKYGGRQIFVPTLSRSRFGALSTLRDVAKGAFDVRQHVLGRLRRLPSRERAGSRR